MVLTLIKPPALLKQLLLIITCCVFFIHAHAQNYLRGTVYDEKGNVLSNVQIRLHSKGTTPFYSGTTGAFGIPTSVMIDTITLQLTGYETLKTVVSANKFQTLTMKTFTGTVSVTKHKLLSFTKDENNNQVKPYYTGGESYSSLVENVFTDADKFPETGFVINVDRASYSNVRRFLNAGSPVPPDAVRIEEMLNYFNLSYQKPDSLLHKFACNAQITSCPWNAGNELLFVNIQAPIVNLENVPPCSLIFLIDVSGSMDEPNRLPLLKDAFKLLVKNLRSRDSVAIVVYGGGVGILLQPTSGGQKDSINGAIDQLEAGGETPGEAAIKTAYALAERSFNKNGSNRIILATDGDFNVGQTTDKELEDLVTQHRQSGIFLTCLGVGMGNYKDSKLETLAKKGNGNFAYLDNLREAEKVLVTEFTKTLYVVAQDAYTSVTFNPAAVKRYRLIGFDNKADALNDSTSQIEGGEVGTAHSLMAVFEIEPVSKTITNNIAHISIHYKLPESEEEQQQNFSAINNLINLKNADSTLRFAASVCMFGELLKQSELMKNYSWDDVLKLAQASANTNDFQQAEFIALTEEAKKIYGNSKRKRKASDN